MLLLTCTAFSQELSESNIRSIRKVQGLLLTNPEKAYQDAKKMAASENEIFSLCGTYYIVNYHYNKSDYGKAKKILIWLLDTIEKSGKSGKRYIDLKAMSLNKLFYIHKNLGEYGLGLFYLDKYKKNIPYNRFDEHYGIAKIALGNYAEGISMLKNDAAFSPHLRLGESESKTMNDKLFADKFNTIGESYQKYYKQTKKPALLDSADLYFNKAAKLMIDDQFEVDYTKALLSLRNANSALLREKYKQALALYRKGKSYSVINQNIRTVQLFDLGMADSFYHLKQYDSAVAYSHRYIKNYAVTKISNENLLIAYNILSKSYNAKNESKNAYSFAQKSLSLIDSIDMIKHRSLSFVHNYDLKKIKSESKEILNEKTYFKFGLFGILAVLAVTISGFYYYYLLQKKKHQRFLEIIKRSRKKPENAIPLNTADGPILKSTMDEFLVNKIAEGLKKLEEKQAYLKPVFKLGYVASKLNTNTAYLSQYFNQVLNKSFSEYTQELRINYVLQKLNDDRNFSNYTLQAIAEEVGYKDATTFVRVFKKQTGLTPNYYIEELRK